MPSYQTSLKTWGSTGQEPPDNYSYVEGEQPVDAWDNWFNSNIVTDIEYLITLTNNQLDSSAQKATPSSPEAGQLWYDTVSGELKWWDADASTWRIVFPASGGVIDGDLDLRGNTLLDSTVGGVQIEGSGFEYEWYENFDGGTVAQGSLMPLTTVGLDDTESLQIRRATLTEDAFGTPVDSGVDLIITDGSSSLVDIVSGDGTTVHDDVTGDPVIQYTNDTGGHQTVSVAIDNGQFNAGAGADVSAYAGFKAQK